jgi:hypothetical protein
MHANACFDRCVLRLSGSTWVPVLDWQQGCVLAQLAVALPVEYSLIDGHWRFASRRSAMYGYVSAWSLP